MSEDVGDANFIIERVGGSDGAASVTVSTFDGSAVAGNDYTQTTLTFDFADGQTSQDFAVPILNDSIGERDESFYVNVTNVTGGAAIGDGATAEVTIVDDEAAAASTFVVTNSDDDGAGSLRQAIVDANARPGFDFVNFDIPGPGSTPSAC